MVVLRRRRRWVVPAVPVACALTAAAALLVVVLFCHSLLGSTDASRLPHIPSSILLKNPGELQRNVVESAAERQTEVDQSMPELYQKSQSGNEISVDDLWASKSGKGYHGCSNASKGFATAEANTLPDRYLMIATSGGLNQQRTGIIDAVVVARILNATLVIPKLDQKSFWKDASDFAEIFDVDWFISSLAKDVKIIKQLPSKSGKVTPNPWSMRVPRKCNQKCYETKVLPALMKKHVVLLKKFDYRLANVLETDLQKLRCRVNYHALRFTNQIQSMGNILIQRIKEKSRNFIALHLRFEPDMLAFSGCYYGGGEKERRELGAIRKRWKALHAPNPEKERRHGKCPLTPEEVGLMLRALGFGNDTHIYVASGEVYGGEETLAPLKALFPNFHTKETLATKEELAPFSSYSSRMAALDFIVSDKSDVFVTNNNGNMARMLAGRRRYFGHKRTIRPNAKKLSSLFLNRSSMIWEVFSSKVRTFQKGFMGEPNEVQPGRGEFHENPATCICENSNSPPSEFSYETRVKIASIMEKDDTNRATSNKELDWTDFDYGESIALGRGLPNGDEPEDDHLSTSFEEIISD